MNAWNITMKSADGTRLETAASKPMQQTFFAGLLIVAAAMLNACSDENSAPLTQKSTADADSMPLTELIAQARLDHAQAQELGYGWTATDTYLQQADAALQSGDGAGDSTAVEQHALEQRALAQRALTTAQASIRQAVSEQANTGPLDRDPTTWQKRFRSSFNMPSP